MINIDLEKQIQQQIENAIQSYLDSDSLQVKIQDQIDSAVGKIIQAVSSKIYADVSNSVDIKNQITRVIELEANQQIHQQSINLVRQQLDKTSVGDIIEKIVNKEIKVKFDKLEFPEKSIHPNSISWYPRVLNGNHIAGGCIGDFSSTGIDDKALSCQLTIMDNHVVVEKDFTASKINAIDTITTKNLIVTDNLEYGSNNGSLVDLISKTADRIINQKTSIIDKLFHNGEPLITENSIANTITQSNLRKLGNLLDLTVSGDAKFSETLLVSASGRVGINSEDPKGALTIRDDDAEISFVKTNRRTMFIGSTRDINIELGANNQNQMVFRDQLIDINSAVNFMGIKISVSNHIPEHIGIPNEIVFTPNSRDNQPKFYLCKGGNKWQSMF